MFPYKENLSLKWSHIIEARKSEMICSDLDKFKYAFEMLFDDDEANVTLSIAYMTYNAYYNPELFSDGVVLQKVLNIAKNPNFGKINFPLMFFAQITDNKDERFLLMLASKKFLEFLDGFMSSFLIYEDDNFELICYLYCNLINGSEYLSNLIITKEFVDIVINYLKTDFKKFINPAILLFKAVLERNSILKKVHQIIITPIIEIICEAIIDNDNILIVSPILLYISKIENNNLLMEILIKKLMHSLNNHCAFDILSIIDGFISYDSNFAQKIIEKGILNINLSSFNDDCLYLYIKIFKKILFNHPNFILILIRSKSFIFIIQNVFEISFKAKEKLCKIVFYIIQNFNSIILEKLLPFMPNIIDLINLSLNNTKFLNGSILVLFHILEMNDLDNILILKIQESEIISQIKEINDPQLLLIIRKIDDLIRQKSK